MKTKLKRIGSVFLSFAVSLQIFMGTTGGLSLTAFAASGTVIGPYTIVGGMRNIDYKLENDVLYILSDIPLTIANTDISTAATVPIVVNADVNGNITLAGVNITPASAAAIDVSPATQSKANVTITLADDTTNTLKGGSGSYLAGYAGLQKNGAYVSENEGRLVIQGGVKGNGQLTATGGTRGAGIGSGVTSYYPYNSTYASYASNIIISGGTIIATGGNCAAGIGSGCTQTNNSISSNITISGGTVIATGSNGAAGIGSGKCYTSSYDSTIVSRASDITISGGSITATGGNYGAGIGSGSTDAKEIKVTSSAIASNIVISGGVVTATGGTAAAGIGSGYSHNEGYSRGSDTATSRASDITISGGSITATGGNYGAGIGSGYSFSDGDEYDSDDDSYDSRPSKASSEASNIIISGGTVIAMGGAVSVGIGAGYSASYSQYASVSANATSTTSDVIISGGIVTATGGNGNTSKDDDSGILTYWAQGSGIGASYAYAVSSRASYATSSSLASNIKIENSSVKAEGGTLGVYKGATIGISPKASADSTPVLPINTNDESLYLAVIENPNNGPIVIDGEEFPVTKHADGDLNVYAYLTDTFHVVTVDDVSKAYNPRTGQTLPLPDVTAPTAIVDLVYNTSEQTLIEAGETSNGTMKYALDKLGPWSTELPTATNADTYTVWYKSEGDNVTIASTNPESIEVTIAKAPWVFSQGQLDNISATSLIYEQTLADSIISGSDAYDGTYAWKEPDTMPTVADSNRTGFPIVFTPADTNYDATETTCKLIVSKKSHTFTASDIANLLASELVYGQTLSESVITGPTPVTGSYRFVNGATIPTVLGANDFTVEFVPADTDNYEISSVGDVHITVNQADPIITAEQLAAMIVSEITYGQTLSDSTITARSTTPGRFEWTHPDTAPVVANSLNTDYEILFTPDDTDNYKTRTIYKTIKVNPAPIILSEAIKQSVTATGITYGDTLADSVISGDVPQAGHYEWADNTIAPSVADSNTTAYDVVFVPDDENYANAALTCTLMVSKKAFTFTQSDIDNLSASDLTYGQTLSQSIISGDKPVDGSYRWVNGSAVPTVNGTNNFAFEFVPTDTDNYEVVPVGDIHVTVNKAEPIITAEQLAAMTVSEITYGQTLADSTITATATIPGSFAWSDNGIAPTVADSLTTEYNILFTPNDTDNYTTKLIAKTVKVNKATPTVPEDIATSISATEIKFGKTLNDSTLSYIGSGTLTGNLSWTNPETTPAMVDSDVTAYDVTYTPADAVNYNTLSYTATVHVDKGEAPSSLQDFSTTVSTDVSEDSSGISTENADGSITIDLSELLGIPGVSGIIKDVSDPNNMFDGTPVITDGTKLTYKTNPVPTDTTGTITITVSSRDYEDFDIEITIKATNCSHEHVTDRVGYRAATCSTKGYTGDTVCNDCGCTIAYGQDIATTSHTPIVKNRVAPTCTSEGYSGDVYCKDCGVFVASGRILATTDHTEGEPVVTKPATYDAEGEQRYYCKDCNAYIRSEVVPKLSLDGHEHVWVSGYGHDDCDHWKECTECHYLFDKAAHTFNDGDFITATCTTEGSVKYICTVCGYEVTKIETPGHRPVWRYDEHGDKHYKQCKVCGKVFESEVHAYGHWVETVTPTDSKLGTYVRSCTECGYIEIVQSAANPEISSNTGGGETGQNNDLLNGGQTGSGKNPDTGIEFTVIRFAALALVAGATILLSRRCKI